MNPIVVSWSEISAFRQCPHKHWLAYVERWQPPTEAENLARGTLFHLVMEYHYQALRSLVMSKTAKGAAKLAHKAEYVRLMNLIEATLGVRDLSQTERQQLVLWMYQGYIEQYGDDASEWDVIDVERKEIVPLPHPSGGESRFHLKVKIDLVARFRKNQIWIWDHKTCSNLPQDKELELDDQLRLYGWTLRQMGVPVEGAVYNAVLTRKNKKSVQPLDARHFRAMMPFTDEELAMVAAEAYWTAEKMWPLVEDRSHIPERTPDPDTCRWKCDFTEPCLSSRRGGKSHGLLQAYGFKQSTFREAELEIAAMPVPLPRR